MDDPRPLGALSTKDFLRDYWQQRPLVVRGAFAGVPPGLTPEELAGLACEPDVESRIVAERADELRWHLRHGPFSEDDFQTLPDRDWTVLVQDVDKHLPGLQSFLAPFRFLPDWRIDDLMVSYAAPGGSVGPHVDRYDVFLIQALGSREWRIGEAGSGEPRPHPSLDLVRDFEPVQSWMLEPGDMLYLPPGVPHHGIALDACMTYSVGFRAPSLREVAMAYCERLLERLGDKLYTDPTLSPAKEPADIGEAVRLTLHDQLQAVLDAAPELLDEAFAQVVSEPKPAFAERPIGTELAVDGVPSMLAAGVRLHPWSRHALLPHPEGARLYADGQGYDVSPSDLPWLRRLLRDHRLAAGSVPDLQDNLLLRQLLAAGAVEPCGD